MKSPIPLTEFDASYCGIEKAVTFPAESFTSEEFYKFEKDAIFSNEWLCIGRANDIPKKGDYFTRDIIGEPLIVVRQADGTIKTLSNVCRHRAMRVAEGAGSVRRFRCVYHSWVYGLDGQLQSAPDLNESEYFNKSEVKLPEIRTEVWEGFIFITLNDDIPSISERLKPLGEYLKNWELESLHAAAPLSFFEVSANWKVFGDECYHCAHLHSQSWCPMYETTSEMIDYNAPYNNVKQA